ncbi:branched-chain amino acid ABC transporter permease [Deferribacter autotrophicus]|uniref:Branched-chain amino acid ABC transporter permease n=1 Tax=Deferribacter autotrophicus TaxID=500465 RepID=A0A5A8F0L6_9BACT|nr:branched-chain amino acid ABC transporter permease [Deferribacter autotrophicus]KAA0256857.1 branched-chain amino acid ABC transporter permease [Deferribacter autotrophicus]
MEVLIVLVDALIYSSWIFLIAVGLTLIYGVMRILNMAHGSFYAIGAYTAASIIVWYYGYYTNNFIALLLYIVSSIIIAIITGFILEKFLLRYMYGNDEVLMVLVTYAVLLMFEDIIKLVWGVDGYFAYQPYTMFGNISLGNVSFVGYDLFLILVALLIGFLLWFMINKTIVGKKILAVIFDREVSVCLGINVSKIFLFTFLLGCSLSAVAGALTAPAISVVPGIGVEVIIVSFAVVVIGGLGSIEGSLLGALIVGLARSFAIHYFPQFDLFVIYVVMALVLLFRPQGLFYKSVVRKI